MLRWVAMLGLLLALSTGQSGAVRAADKVYGLLVGNSDYPKFKAAGQDRDLKLAKNDVIEIGKVIKRLDPKANIEAKLDVSAKDMLRHIGATLKSLDDGDTFIFVFSGHGYESAGVTYLIPSDFSPDDLSDPGVLQKSAVSMQEVLDRFARISAEKGKRKGIAGIFIIDACRENIARPPGSKSAAASGGIVASYPPAGSIVLYSAGSKQLALERLHAGDAEATSLYTRKLLARLKMGDVQEVAIERIAKDVRFEVYRSAAREARPRHLQNPAYIDEMLNRRNFLGRKITESSNPKRQPNIDVASRATAPIVVASNDSANGAITKGLLTHGGIVQDCPDCPVLINLPGGHAVIGSEDDDALAWANEKKRKTVMLKPFAIGRYEVSRDEWLVCQRSGKCPLLVSENEEPRELQRPITRVSFEDTSKYIAWLNELVATKDPKAARYRLPSETEWEYSARAGSEAAYAFGDDPAQLCIYANGADASAKAVLFSNPMCRDQHARGLASVASYKPNAFGLHNMHGNAWEWTADCYAPTHDGIDKAGAARSQGEGVDCGRRVVRGGSWRSAPNSLRSARRIAYPTDHRRGTVGFRVALSLGGQ